MPRTPRMKLARSEKQKAADKKNLADWEAKQAEEARVSNDKVVADIAYKEGYDKGHTSGYLDGQAVGFANGKSVGFIEGFEDKKRLSYVNMFSGFVIGFSVCLISMFVGLGLSGFIAGL